MAQGNGERVLNAHQEKIKRKSPRKGDRTPKRFHNEDDSLPSPHVVANEQVNISIGVDDRYDYANRVSPSKDSLINSKILLMEDPHTTTTTKKPKYLF